MSKNREAKQLATELAEEIKSLAEPNAANLRKAFHTFTAKLKDVGPEFIFDLARELLDRYGLKSIAYALIQHHKEALQRVDEQKLHEFGRDLNTWGDADSFAAFMAGPAWLNRQIPDELIVGWAHSEDRWWRRIAVVSTIALNKPTWGGSGDIQRTLKICRLLVEDRDDMVVKAMSWALRELIRHDAGVVRGFLDEYDDVLAGRVRREVRNKLTTGVKNPQTNRK
jgi:3-methyladenine DNA glycosylase AlkD